MAVDLARVGMRVAITYRHNRVGAEKVVREVRKAGGEVQAYFVADLASDAQVRRLFERVTADFGQVDAVVANAGGPSYAAKDNLDDLDVTAWRDDLKDNLLATVMTTKYAVRAMRAHDTGGKIVLMGSALGLDGAGNPAISAYSAAKAATHSFARTIAKTLAPKIIVNVVAPGRCWSRGYDHAAPEVVAAKMAPNKHGRFIEGAEIAQAVRMVLENDSIIGQVVPVEAGFTLLPV